MSTSPGAAATGLGGSPRKRPNLGAGSDADLLESGYLADAIVKCGDKTFKVHRLILCHRCLWFKACFDGHYKESQDYEVTIHDEDPSLVECLLFYIYSQDLAKTMDKLVDVTQWSRYKACIMLWKMGDFFLLPELKGDTYLKWTALYRADFPRICSLHDNTSFSIDEISDAVDAAYTIPNATWWRNAIVMSLCMSRRNTLKSNKIFDLMEKNPQFAIDFLKSLRYSSEIDTAKDPICGMCFTEVTKSQDGILWHDGTSDKVHVRHLDCLVWQFNGICKP